MKLHSYISWKPFSAPVPNLEAADSISSKHIPYFFHHNFPLHELKSGNYYFNIELKSENGIVLDKKTLFFQRYNKLPISTNTIKTDSSKISKEDTSNYSHVLDLTTTFVGKYNAQQVRAVLKMLLLICTPLEGGSISGFLKKPDELYSKYFIYNFWEKRDKLNPEKAWKLYAEKIKEVNKLFGGSGKPGYETDRGRIYIQYGKPNDRIIVNNESGALPYEIWQYYNSEKQGQEGVFLFYRSGTALGGYTLLHSTFVGEKKNSSWRSLLYNNSITGSGGLNSDSQAEQYIKNR
jgi:GWxTD domain-containing protein